MGEEKSDGIAETMKTAAAEVAELQNNTSAPKGVTEQEIAEKVALGLHRDQAIEILQRDAAEAAPAEGKSKGKK
jgi:hypothetical protein